MSEFASEITERVAQASTSLRNASNAGDDYLVEVRVGELEDLARVAADHDVEVPGLQATLAAHTGPIDIVLPEEPAEGTGSGGVPDAEAVLPRQP
jgi:hypothetical protein